MNQNQKKLLIGIIIIIILMLIYPPFQLTVYGSTVNFGYGLIFNPPSNLKGYKASVDVGLLITQWIGTIVAGGIGVFLLKSK